MTHGVLFAFVFCCLYGWLLVCALCAWPACRLWPVAIRCPWTCQWTRLKMRGEEDGWSETSILKRASKYSPDENPDESEGFYFLFQSSDAL
jgi:hypothetical protein